MTAVALEHRKVLVLNKNWTAIGFTPLVKAFSKLFSTYKTTGEPKARIIDPTNNFGMYTWADWAAIRPSGDEDSINAGHNMRFKIPEVILLSRYDKMPEQRIHFSRRAIYRRDGYRCQYCGRKPGTSELTIDHILPSSRGGKTTWGNCCLACVACNSLKADRTPEQAGMKLMSKPKRPRYDITKGNGNVWLQSWNSFFSEVYWNVELENDEKE